MPEAPNLDARPVELGRHQVALPETAKNDKMMHDLLTDGVSRNTSSCRSCADAVLHTPRSTPWSAV